MSSWFNYFAPRRDPKQSARDAIVGLRQQLQTLEKKEDHLRAKADEHLKKAKANAVSNKSLATLELKRKKQTEHDLERLAGTKLQLESQLNVLENANLNVETIMAMDKAAKALKSIHRDMTADKADAVMASVNEERAQAEEISTLISTGMTGDLVDEDELQRELEGLEQEALDERLQGAEHVPLHQPEGRVVDRHVVATEDDEEEQLRQLQAELAMA